MKKNIFKFSSIFMKVYLNYVALVLLFALVLGFTFINLFNNSNSISKTEQVERLAESAAARMRQYILDDDYEEALSYLELFNELDEGEIWTVAYPDAAYPMNSLLESVNISQVELQPEFTELIDSAFSGKNTTKTFFSEIHGVTAIVTSVPLFGKANKVCGSLLIIVTMEELAANTATGIKLIITSVFIAALISMLLSLLFAKQITSPMTSIRKVAVSLREGDYSAKSNISRTDEIGEMAKSVDMLADRLAENEEERKNRDQARLDFFANVSHELRTPIAVVRAYTESLVDGVVSEPEKVDQYHERILTECKSMERLVGDLLTLSKMQNPSFKIDREPVNLVHVFDDIVRSALAISNEKGIQIVMHRDSNVCMILGDYDRLRQMFMVILDNAIKFSPQGSEIFVTLKSQKRKIICSIRDTGTGISEEEIPNIFDKFYKSKLRQNAKGTGLGLPIAKYICLKHEGSIDVKSKPGEGTEFIFTFDEIFEEDL